VEEEAEVAAKTIRKLRDKQEALIAAPGVDDMSASEWQMREERDKLLVSTECRGVGCFADCAETAQVFML
jgi:hypothetical protein